MNPRKSVVNIDKKYMRIALRLARKAEGLTNPNPAVGAVIVKNGKIVGKGYHKACGLPHAEVNALKAAAGAAKGATLYVTLEPCGHFGRTPPCTDAIMASGIKRVVAAMKDPNPLNNGRGIKKLRRHGIKTAVNVLEHEARSINRPFIKFMTKKMPYVTVKIAESIDGKIATKTGESKWITSEDARSYVHRLRGHVDAVMVGVNTVIKDDPILLSRSRVRKQPARIIVDSKLRTPRNARIFSGMDESPVIIATAKKGSDPKGTRPLLLHAKSKRGRIDLKDLLKTLGGMGIMHVLVEGGGELVGSLVEERLADRFLFFVAPKIIGGSLAPTPVEGSGIRRMRDALNLNNVKIKKFANDILIECEASRCLRV